MQAKQRLELAALFQFTYIGAPTVFYGDEAAINAPSLYSELERSGGRPLYAAPLIRGPTSRAILLYMARRTPT